MDFLFVVPQCYIGTIMKGEHQGTGDGRWQSTECINLTITSTTSQRRNQSRTQDEDESAKQNPCFGDQYQQQSVGGQTHLIVTVTCSYIFISIFLPQYPKEEDDNKTELTVKRTRWTEQHSSGIDLDVPWTTTETLFRVQRVPGGEEVLKWSRTNYNKNNNWKIYKIKIVGTTILPNRNFLNLKCFQ